MKLFNIPASVYISTIPQHGFVKDLILQQIASMGEHRHDFIFNTDWHLGKETCRPYYDIVKPIIENHNEEIKILLGYEKLYTINYWFQQYKTGDWHGWHIHNSCVFSNVYFVNLTGDNPKTRFRYLGEEFTVPVEEGTILTFPSYLHHQSPENTSSEIKTVIAWNTDGN
jgi:hypothetical protein